MSAKRTAIKKFLTKAAVAAFWCLVWQLIYQVINNPLYLSSPCSTFKAMIVLFPESYFWTNIGLSLLRVLLGLTIGCISGIGLAWLTNRFKWMHELFSPILTLTKTVPVVSFIMLLWLAFFRQKGIMPVIISSLMVFPIAWTKMTDGYRTMDQKLLEMAKCYSNPLNTFLYVRLPHLFPFLISGVSTSVGLAWKAGIAAEVICQPLHSIGEEIYTAKGNLDTDILFAWTAVVVILSILLEAILVKILTKIKFRPRIRISDQYAQNGRSFPLELNRINKTYGEHVVLKDFSYHFSNGKTIAIMGSSGCGKTTLLSIASGLIKDDDKKFEFPPTAPAIIFQENRLIPDLTVGENILFANRGANLKRILKSLSLTEDVDKYPHELSGGMQRRVAIGRAMAFDGGIGIFDEPFTGLDEDTKALCAQALFSTYKGRTVLFVTHDTEDARRYGDEILKM